LPAPPVARVIPHTFERHGRWLTDDYAWLHDRSDPAVRAYLEAENAYARAAMRHTEALQERLFEEMRGRIAEDDSSAPQRRGEYFYYTRAVPGRQYRLFCRKHGSLDAPEELLLDENALAEGASFCHVRVFEPSPDHALLAYSVDTTGAREFDLFVKDLRSGAVLAGPIAHTAYTAAWATDGRTLFYTTFDESHRPYKLFRHAAGDDPADDALVYHEPDDAFWLHVGRTRGGAYILLTIASYSASEVRYLAASEPAGALKLVHPRAHGLEYYVEHHGERFLIWTNDGAENFKLVEAPAADPSKARWREIVPHRADTLIEFACAFRDHLALYERQGGLRRIRVSNPDGITDARYVPFPEPVYSFEADSFSEQVNPEFDTAVLRFYYSSLVTPREVVDYDMAGGAWNVVKRQEIPSGYDAARYTAERLDATAADGAQVPISLVYRRDLRRAGSNPLLLEAYGAYGDSSDPCFDATRLSLLDRGFVYAIAHVRGGSELGRSWYEQGRLLRKKHTFTDFIACAEHLVARGYTTPERLAIRGLSAGGLLMSAVANMRPELFAAVVALVPYTNVIAAMLMPELPLTVGEYEQWGHPDDPQAFEYMLSYSPYENIEAKPYPQIYATAGWNDLQVPYWDPAKWVAKLRATKTDGNRLVLFTNMAAGHSGASGRYDELREEARIYAFLLDALGEGGPPERPSVPEKP
jgi:oligopeptidase B